MTTPQPLTVQLLQAGVRRAEENHAYPECGHLRLSNGPNGLEKIHAGGKLPPRYFWQPGFEKTNFAIFLNNLRPITIRSLQASVVRAVMAIYIWILHIGLSNGPNRLEKLHGGAKFLPRYFWQPGSEKKSFCHFSDQPPTHDGPTVPSWCAKNLAQTCIFEMWTPWAFQRSQRIGKTPRWRQVTPPTPLHHGLSKTHLGSLRRCLVHALPFSISSQPPHVLRCGDASSRCCGTCDWRGHWSVGLGT